MALGELEDVQSRLTKKIAVLIERLKGVLLCESETVGQDTTDPCLVPIAHQIYRAKECTTANLFRIQDLLDRLELSG